MASTAFSIEQAQTRMVDNVYRLSANFRFELSEQIVEALHNGVPITLTLDMSIYRERSYIWDEQIASLTQSYQIRYQALTKQYMVKNLNTGLVDNFKDIQGAYENLDTLENFPLIDSKLISPDSRHYTMLRTRVDLDSLPVPLRLRAYFSSVWALSSEWYTCRM